MNRDTRLSDVLHVLLHMDQVQEPLTSELLARSMGTNPAVFKAHHGRLARGRPCALEKGHGGGWRLARPLREITLLAVYEALGRPEFFAIGNRTRHPDCLVEKGVNAVMADTMAEAEALFAKRFGDITLDEITPRRRVPASVHAKALKPTLDYELTPNGNR